MSCPSLSPACPGQALNEGFECKECSADLAFCSPGALHVGDRPRSRIPSTRDTMASMSLSTAWKLSRGVPGCPAMECWVWASVGQIRKGDAVGW